MDRTMNLLSITTSTTTTAAAAAAAASGSILVVVTSYSLYSTLVKNRQRQQLLNNQEEVKNQQQTNDSNCYSSSAATKKLNNWNILRSLNVFDTILSNVQSIVLKPKDEAVIEQKQHKLSHEIPTTNTTIQKKQRKKKVCPFSSESSFIITVKDDAPIPPMDLYEDWFNPTSYNDSNNNDTALGETRKQQQQQYIPLSVRWLNAGFAGQDTPGLLRAGLRQLPDSKYFLIEESYRIQEELQMKANAYNDPTRYSSVYVYEQSKESINALNECLQLFLNYLPKRYPDMYQYDSINNTLYVVPLKETFIIADWMGHRALELCGRIVQEDLVLMRPSNDIVVGCQHSNGKRNDVMMVTSESQHVMAAAAVVFSFNSLQEKLGQPMTFIHMPVPQYESDLRKTINITFNKLLKNDTIMWRSNWGIDPNGILDEPLYGSPETQVTRTMLTVPTIDDIRTKRYIKVEYQTIRRLPQSNYILFTVKSMVDPLNVIESVPNAAKSLAKSIRCMSSNVLNYKGIPNTDTRDVILSYLDSIE